MKQLSYSLFFALASLIYGCSVQKSASTAVSSKQTFSYDYKTTTSTKPGSASTLMSLMRPKYAVNFAYQGNELFENFRKFMANDVEELLIDKGFRLKGPFQSFDEMVFNDKKDADVAIEIEIEPIFTAAQGGWTQKISTLDRLTQDYSGIWYQYHGTVSLIGKINIVGKEPLSGEKLWVKSVEIPSIQNITITTTSKLQSKEVDDAFFNDPSVYNALGSALQQQYKGIMQKMDAHFDPQEFASLKPQIKELKAKKGY